MLDKKKIKEKIRKWTRYFTGTDEGYGELNQETGEWEATPEEIEVPESDENDKADRFEDSKRVALDAHTRATG